MSFILREQQQLIALKKEDTYATDSVPSAADALLVQDISIKAVDANVTARNNVTGRLGAQGSISNSIKVTGSFAVELAGSGAAGTSPAYERCYLSAGVASVTTAATSVAYSLIDTGYESDTLAWYVGNVLHKIIGVRGAFKWDLSAGGVPKLMYNFTGLYITPKIEAQPAGVDLSAFKIPKSVSGRTVSLFNFFGQTLAMKSLSVDPGIDVVHLDEVNDESVQITGRSGSLSVTFREPDLATINFFDLVANNAIGAMNYQLGTDVTDDGHIFALGLASSQLKSIDRSFDQGISYLKVDADIIRSSDDSEILWEHR